MQETMLDIWHLLHSYTIRDALLFYEYSVKMITSVFNSHRVGGVFRYLFILINYKKTSNKYFSHTKC